MNPVGDRQCETGYGREVDYQHRHHRLQPVSQFAGELESGASNDVADAVIPFAVTWCRRLPAPADAHGVVVGRQ